MAEVTESCIVPTPVAQVWEVLAPLDFKFLKSVEEVKCASPETQGAVGSECTVVSADGASQTLKITRSDAENFELAYEVVSSSTPLPCPSILHVLKLLPVTAANQTYLEFSTIFNEEISLKEYIDCKFDKRSFFEALKNFISLSDSSSEWNCAHCTLLNSPTTIRCSACDKERKIPENKYQSTKVSIAYMLHAEQSQFSTPPFQLAGHSWELLVFPRGNATAHVSIYLKILDLVDQGNEAFFCNFRFKMLLAGDERNDKKQEMGSYHTFTYQPDMQDRGFKEVIPLSDVPWYLDDRQELTLQVDIAPLPQPNHSLF